MVKNYNIVEGRNAPIKTWSRGVPFDEKTIGQLQNLATLPYLQMGGGYAGCSLGYGIDCWFGDSNKRRDYFRRQSASILAAAWWQREQI